MGRGVRADSDFVYPWGPTVAWTAGTRLASIETIPLEKSSHNGLTPKGRWCCCLGRGRRQTKPFYVHLRLCLETDCGLVIVDVLQLGTKNNKGRQL